MAKVDYPVSCLEDTKCAWPTRKAAIYDYVGAVYGEEGKVQFNDGTTHFLTDQERSYVEKQFGLLKKPADITSYLSAARLKFLRNLKLVPNVLCEKEEQENPIPIQLTHPQRGTGFVLGGSHSCGEIYFKQWEQSHLEFLVAQDPKSFVFFLEGYNPSKQTWLQEGVFIRRVAEVFNIPIYEPVSHATSHPAVMQKAAKGTGYRFIDFQAARVFSRINGLCLSPSSRERCIQDEIDLMAKEARISSEELAENMQRFVVQYPVNGPSYGTEINRRVQLLADAANQLSEAQLKTNLDRLAGERKDKEPLKVIYIIGSRHIPLIQNAYK